MHFLSDRTKTSWGWIFIFQEVSFLFCIAISQFMCNNVEEGRKKRYEEEDDDG